MNDKLNAVIELVSELGMAFGVPPKPGKEREPSIDALVAVARFARAVGLREAQWELTVLAYTLQDLDVGIVGPLVRPSKRKGGSPPDSSVTWLMRVRVLVALDALRKSGMTQEKATVYINSEYPKLRRLMTRGRDLPGTIKRWRRELEEAKQDTFLATFAQQMIDLEEDVKNISAPMSMTPDRWRQFADNLGPNMHFIDYHGLRDRGIPGSKITIWRKERENRFPRRTRFSAKYYGWPDGVIDAYLVALAAGQDETTATAIAERARPTQTEAA